MAEFVALLRGVNVGGVKVVMADLRRIAAGLGWGDPQTYIASGNLLFSAAGEGEDLRAALEGALAADYGRALPVRVIGAADFAATLIECPFDPEEGKHVHGYFPFGPTAFDDDRYARLRRASEAVVITPGAAWLHAPEGVGRSDLAQTIEAVLGVAATGRNLNSLRKIAELLDARQAA